MTQFLNIDREQLFQDLVERGRQQGVTDQEAYHELCDDLVAELLEVGEMDEDADTIGIVSHLKGRWPDFQEALSL